MKLRSHWKFYQFEITSHTLFSSSRLLQLQNSFYFYFILDPESSIYSNWRPIKSDLKSQLIDSFIEWLSNFSELTLKQKLLGQHVVLGKLRDTLTLLRGVLLAPCVPALSQPFSYCWSVRDLPQTTTVHFSPSAFTPCQLTYGLWGFITAFKNAGTIQSSLRENLQFDFYFHRVTKIFDYKTSCTQFFRF